jgi:hypothetical protein
MNIELSNLEFRRLVDLVYVGNWVLNAAREPNDHIADYDELEGKILSYCPSVGMDELVSKFRGEYLPSKEYEDGGIHEAISDYEDSVFFEILAEELARRDMAADFIDDSNLTELGQRIDTYMAEFEANGTTNLVLETI